MQLHILTIRHLFTISIFLEIKVHVTSISWALLHVWCFPYYSFTVWLFLIFFSPIDSSNLDLQLFSLLHIKCLCLKRETWVAFLTVMYFLLCPPNKRKTTRQLLNLQLQKFAFIMVYLSQEIIDVERNCVKLSLETIYLQFTLQRTTAMPSINNLILLRLWKPIWYHFQSNWLLQCTRLLL